MVGRLFKILSWNVTKLGLFFNIVPFEVHTLLPPVLQYLDPIIKKKQTNKQKRKKKNSSTDCHQKNSSHYKIFSQPSYILFLTIKQNGKNSQLSISRSRSLLYVLCMIENIRIWIYILYIGHYILLI